MVGVGTGNVDLDAFQYSFCSLLGRDGESWGLSYYGKAHHKGQFANFRNARFGQGSILGLHLDMWQGTLSYYKNRQPLGKLRTFSFLASYLHLLLYCTSLCQCLIHNSTPHSSLADTWLLLLPYKCYCTVYQQFFLLFYTGEILKGLLWERLEKWNVLKILWKELKLHF